MTEESNVDNALLEKFEKEAIKRDVKIRYLGPINNQTIEFVKARQKFKVEAKNYSSPLTRFAVWDSKILMISIKKDKEEFMSLWIDNEVLSRIFEEHFENLWEKASKI